MIELVLHYWEKVLHFYIVFLPQLIHLTNFQNFLEKVFLRIIVEIQLTFSEGCSFWCIAIETFNTFSHEKPVKVSFTISFPSLVRTKHANPFEVSKTNPNECSVAWSNRILRNCQILSKYTNGFQNSSHHNPPDPRNPCFKCHLSFIQQFC